MANHNIVILGAGIAGLCAAFQIASKNKAKVIVLEKDNVVGGNSGGFEIEGIPVDYGSHRLHPSCDLKILNDISSLLKDDLLVRPRHGRIRLQGQWIHFPLKPVDLLFKLPSAFSLKVLKDMFLKILPKQEVNIPDTFSAILENGLGKTISKEFYFPYSAKMWGLNPDNLSATQARRRISASSLPKMIKKILLSMPGLKPTMSGKFFYPKNGFQQICKALFNACKDSGVEFHFNINLDTICFAKYKNNRTFTTDFEKHGTKYQISSSHVWSTIPITMLTSYLKPSPPRTVLKAAKELEYRSMILVYMVLNQNRFSEYDAHYFPEIDIPITRLSEPKNYSNSYNNINKTVLCAELPCSTKSSEWTMTDEELSKLLLKSLEKAGIPIKAPLEKIISKRTRFAYPIYKSGWETFFNKIDQWIDEIDSLVTFGRQGLFAHDNVHHALSMAYAAVDCLDNDCQFDNVKWQNYRKIFEEHVVED